MNRLSTTDRSRVLACLRQGNSQRSTVRITGVAKKTVARLAVELGEACERLTFEQGYICAVATLLRQHGETVYAKDLLACMCNVDWSKIDKYDIEALDQFGLYPR